MARPSPPPGVCDRTCAQTHVPSREDQQTHDTHTWVLKTVLQKPWGEEVQFRVQWDGDNTERRLTDQQGPGQRSCRGRRRTCQGRAEKRRVCLRRGVAGTRGGRRQATRKGFEGKGKMLAISKTSLMSFHLWPRWRNRPDLSFPIKKTKT